MPAAFVHLSDIHFGQERGSRVILHHDVKERLVEDVAQVVADLPGRRATGLLVVGDVAYAGRAEEYAAAGKWLDRVAEAAGCAVTDIQVVPGNHDIDRDLISPSMRLMISPLIAAVFPPVYEQLRHGKENPDIWRLFLFSDWDKCRTARHDLVDAFMASSWAPSDLALAAVRADDAERILQRLNKRLGGKDYLWRVTRDVASLPDQVRRAVQTALDAVHARRLL